MPDNNVRLQNLRDFTVQIRNDADQIVGTGIAVSMDGKIVTCAHVVQAAGIEPRNPNGAEIGVYFPQARGGEEKKRRAKVDCCFHEYDDDMVLLQLIEGTSPLAPEQIAVLGMADQSEGNPFRTYGYSPIGDFPATRGDGIIQGSVEPPENRNLQVDPIQLKSRDIAAGMSGAAVLDVTRNLVVGLVAERYYPANAVQDDIGYGVDSKVLTFNPFDFVLRGEALELKPAPEFRLDKDLFKQAMEIANYMLAHRPVAEKYSWNSAPTILPEWTGRDDLLTEITKDWNDPQKHVTGLIGFGGEGKSSLARKWIETLEQPALSISKGSNVSTFDGLFWWGFYENRSIDEFLEAALKYLSGGKIDPRAVPSSSLRAQIIGAMLGAGRYLFVLDGLEVMQHQEGDQYGLLQSNDLRDLLTYFARPDNQSFCLITSRAPLLDLMEYTTYTHRDVDRLSEDDGRALLRKLGVNGSDVELNRVISDWDGHALTISLLGSYLAEKHGGDIAHLADIPVPTADEPRYERVHRVLRRYDEHITETEREFLKLFSAFRTPVHESAFEKVFAPLLKNAAPIPDSQFTNSQITEMVTHLVNYRILRHDATSQTYTAHPLVRNHYLAILTCGDSTEQHDIHGKIKDYYLSIAGEAPQYPTLEDLKPLIEMVYHACQAGAYDEAGKLHYNRIEKGDKFVLMHQLGAYETDLNICLGYFPNNDVSQEPLITDSGYKRWVFAMMGFCLMNLGRLREAIPFFERHNALAIEAQDWHNASLQYNNLTELHTQLGALEESAEAARQALDLAIKSKEKLDKKNALSRWAWALHVSGDLETASSIFGQAEAVSRELTEYNNPKHLTGAYGILHADHLQCIGDTNYARRVSIYNLPVCERSHLPRETSQCHRVLGNLDFASSNHESARAHYESALKIARSISKRDVLIEALLARGRFYAKVNVGATRPAKTETSDGIERSPLPLTDAFNDLNEALNYAVEGGYRIYETDIRVALAWAHLNSPRPLAGEGQGVRAAKAEAERALQMSQEMGYHWGKVDAEEVLERMSNE